MANKKPNAASGNAVANEVRLAEETPLKGLKNGSTIQLVGVAISENGESEDNAVLRGCVSIQRESGLFPQYLLALKNGVVPCIVPISAIARAFDGEEYTPNDLSAMLSEAYGYNALIESGAQLVATIRRGAYTFSHEDAPTTGVRSISLAIKQAKGTQISVTDSERVAEFIALIKSAREYNG